VDLKKWKLDSLPTLVKAPVIKEGAEKGIIRSIENLAKKAESVMIATDYDREGELIGADARDVVRSVNSRRARLERPVLGDHQRRDRAAFAEPGELSDDLAEAGRHPAGHRSRVGRGAHALPHAHLEQAASKRAWGDVLSAGRVQTPTLKLIVDRERERDAFVPEDYWTVKARFAPPVPADAPEFGASHATERFKARPKPRA
jgi:DNA topoisomerase I